MGLEVQVFQAVAGIGLFGVTILASTFLALVEVFRDVVFGDANAAVDAEMGDLFFAHQLVRPWRG